MDGVVLPAAAVRGVPGKQYAMSLGDAAATTNRVASISNNATAQSRVNQQSIAPMISTASSFLDQIGAMSARNSALSQQYAQEANAFSAQQAAVAREFNAAEAEKNRQWQQYMSNTAHQREIADLKAAGLNPVLSAMGGNGAAVTSGATASASNPSGTRGDVDTSANASIVSLLSSMLSAQTQLQAMNTSARTQEAIADKYIALDKLVAEWNNATSRANAKLSAETSRYGIDVSSWTSLSVAEKQAATNRYAAELQSAASRYGSYLSWDAATSIARNQLEWQSQHPNNWVQELNALLEGAGTSTSGVSGSLMSGLSGLFSGSSSGYRVSHDRGITHYSR